MFAIAALPATLTIGGAVALGLVALVIAGGMTFGIARLIKSRKNAKQDANAAAAVPASTPKATPLPGLPGLLGSLGNIDLNNLPPEIKQVVNVLLPAVHQAQQTVVNAAVAKMFPALAPFIPGIDRAISGVDNLIDAKLGIGAGAQPAAPSAATPSPIIFPAGHPVLDLLQKVLEAHLGQKGKAA